MNSGQARVKELQPQLVAERSRVTHSSAEQQKAQAAAQEGAANAAKLKQQVAAAELRASQAQTEQQSLQAQLADCSRASELQQQRLLEEQQAASEAKVDCLQRKLTAAWAEVGGVRGQLQQLQQQLAECTSSMAAGQQQLLAAGKAGCRGG